MEDLAPTYQFVIFLIDDLQTGIPARQSVRRFIEKYQNEMSELLTDWLLLSESGQREQMVALRTKMNAFRRNIFELLDFSAQGSSILEPLDRLEEELRLQSRHELDEHLSKLPFKMMLPLLLLQFPALLILILGPLLMHLLREVQ